MEFKHTKTDLPVESQYPKLVRGKIPEIIEAQLGERPETRVLTDDSEFREFLLKKVVEEAHELKEAVTREHVAEETADLLELIDTVLEFHGLTLEEVRDVQTQKREKRGGFKERLVVTKEIKK